MRRRRTLTFLSSVSHDQGKSPGTRGRVVTVLSERLNRTHDATSPRHWTGGSARATRVKRAHAREMTLNEHKDASASRAWRDCGFATKCVTLDVARADATTTTLRVRHKDLCQPSTSNGEDDDGGEWVDPYFFDRGYTLAATTGFCRVWEGAETLCAWLESAGERTRGKRALELGAGVGACGLVAAALGAHVCLTDTRAVAENVTRRNVEENGEGDASAFAKAWPKSARVGAGSATWATLDWYDDIPENPFGNDQNVGFNDAEVILAAECAWLRDLVPAFVETNRALLSRGCEKELIVSFRDRSSTEDASSGKAFASYREVARAFEDAGCVCEEIQRSASLEDEGKDIVIVSITLRERARYENGERANAK